mgnify:CR=1 FL=1
MHNRMITLCDASHAESKEVGNFSGWVRGKLLSRAIDRPTIDDLEQKQLLGVLMTRHQEGKGYGTEAEKLMLRLMLLV